MNETNTRDTPTAHKLAALALSLVAGAGPRLQARLIREFGSPQAVFAQSYEQLLAVNGVGSELASRIRQADVMADAERQFRLCQSREIDVLVSSDSEFPGRLQEICDPPTVLYRRGTLLPQDDLAIAIVGSRRCTAYGRRQAERLAASLARAGFTIVSGLARGIDAAAHRGALNAGGRTLAVLATGVDQIYPPEHAELATDVCRSGGLLSEMPVQQKPRRGLFPQRNRLISGLSLGIIVVEATRTSGALYTARHGLEQGREVFAVPGPADSLASDGCHELIRDGVTLIRHADDVLQELGPLSTPAVTAPHQIVHHPRELILNALETEVLNAIGSYPLHIDDLLRELHMDASRVLATLTVLEMRRFVRRLPGNVYIRQ